MPLVTTNEMLKKAQAGHYAVGAFNVENMEMVMAVIKAAEEMNSPVIMQTTPSTVKYAGLDYYLAMVRTAAERASVPVAIHLDHGSSFELAMQALRTGYTSIMIDGSHGSFEENVALTPDGRILKSDVRVAKNYLDEKQIRQLERAVSGYFDYIEDLIERENTFTMEEFAASVNEFLAFRRYDILKDKGRVSRQMAINKAETEYDAFNKTQKIVSDFDREVRKMLEEAT